MMKSAAAVGLVSVVTPVYNAGPYLAAAVESALTQPETYEVILVEDGSPDGSLVECEKLNAAHEQVALYRHPDGRNLGAGASRNLGIQKASGKYVAFLDADDFFLPDRFKNAIELLERDNEIDGIFEAIGCVFETSAAEIRWDSSHDGRLTTMTEPVAPEELFEALVRWDKGFFSGDGLIVRTSAFDKTGLFDVDLRLKQDTHMWIKMAAKGRLLPGNLKEPVAMRRMHDHNRTTCDPRVGAYYACMLWRKLLSWSIQEDLSLSRQSMLLAKYLSMTEYHYCSNRSWRLRKLLGLLRLPWVLARWPMSWRLPGLKRYAAENLRIVLGTPRASISIWPK